ncbi:MAG TPA: CCA tRNA nucleotidyltransferase [Candidatus Omnitrophota bacterium]|nr:CCA tRNA nucleotidyltransferase [Candidatus Omnitrophota bacterium]
MFEGIEFPAGALNIIRTLKGGGFKCYLVGGCVRDLLLGKSPSEWDLTTDATPEQVGKSFKKVIPTGIDFGTVTVLIDDSPYEVTTFRRDERYTDGRHPNSVTYSRDLAEDLSRRDFTVNAMAYDPVSGEFVDKYSGTADLKAKLIRAVGDPLKRFGEDGLRSLRACRFAAVLNFDIEPGTFSAISVTLDISKKVALERVHDELVKMLKAEKPSIGFELMRRSGLLDLFLPELVSCHGIEQPPEYHKYDVYWHSLFSCDAAPADNLVARLAALLHDISKPACKVEYTFYNHDQTGAELSEGILKRLKFSNEIISKVSNLIRNHMFDYKPAWSDSAVRRFMRRVGPENLEDLFALRRADTRAMGRDIGDEYIGELKGRIGKIIEDEHALHVKDLKIDGTDVMKALSIPPGPKVGEALNALLEKVLDDPALNERETLLKLLRERR